MNRRRFFVSKRLIPHIMRVTSSQDLIVGATWHFIDLFIVGGGGSGGNWADWGYSPGGGGAGGQCVTVKDILCSKISNIKIQIGSGGQGVYVKGMNAGNPGKSTTVDINYVDGTSEQIVALGGAGGKSCKTDGGVLDFTDITTQGYDERSDSYNYKRTSSTSTLLDIYNAHNKLITNRSASATWNEVVEVKIGVPEFHEEGNPVHAAGGAGLTGFKAITDYSNESGGDFNNSKEGVYLRGGGGYGGGGAGASYRSGYSGAGGAGCVVIRYYTVE